MARVVRKQVAATERKPILEGFEPPTYETDETERKRVWAEELRFMRERAAKYAHLGRPDAPRTWSKEDALEERLRWPRR